MIETVAKEMIDAIESGETTPVTEQAKLPTE